VLAHVDRAPLPIRSVRTGSQRPLRARGALTTVVSTGRAIEPWGILAAYLVASAAAVVVGALVAFRRGA